MKSCGGPAQEAREGQPLAVGRPRRRERDRPVGRELLRVGPVPAHHPQLLGAGAVGHERDAGEERAGPAGEQVDQLVRQRVRHRRRQAHGALNAPRVGDLARGEVPEPRLEHELVAGAGEAAVEEELGAHRAPALAGQGRVAWVDDDELGVLLRDEADHRGLAEVLAQGREEERRRRRVGPRAGREVRDGDHHPGEAGVRDLEVDLVLSEGKLPRPPVRARTNARVLFIKGQTPGAVSAPCRRTPPGAAGTAPQHTPPAAPPGQTQARRSRIPGPASARRPERSITQRTWHAVPAGAGGRNQLPSMRASTRLR